MKKILLITLMNSGVCISEAAIHVINTSGKNFVPANITILAGDTVDFSNIGSNHNVVEVSLSTWNANQSSPLPGGFSFGFGGGMLMTAGLNQGTHYYVCQPHSDDGMKGTIVIQGTVGLPTITTLLESIKAFPNPFVSSLTLVAPGADEVVVYNMLGKEVATYDLREREQAHTLHLEALQSGVYFFSFRREMAVLATRRMIRR